MAEQSGRRLRFMHSLDLFSPAAYAYWQTQPTEYIIDSLGPGANQPLRVREDGLIFQGNTRAFILAERGVDIDKLPFVPHP